MALEMTATIKANNELLLADALDKMSRLVKRGCMYESQSEEGVVYAFRVVETLPLVLDLEPALVLDPDREKLT